MMIGSRAVSNIVLVFSSQRRKIVDGCTNDKQYSFSVVW